MASRKGIREKITFHPLTPSRWKDFEALFGERGACGGCWCMYWRLTHAEFEKKKGKENRRAMKRIVDSSEAPGILAYVDREPAGWCAVARRDAYPRLAGSRILKPVDDQPVWSVVCFFVAKPHRRTGLSEQLLHGAIDYVRRKRGRILEGYPVEPKKDMPDPFVYTGLASAFRRAGFKEVARRSQTRPIMRCEIK